MFMISEGVELLCASMIDRPLNWRQTTYDFRNIKQPDIAIWTCGGVSFYV